MRRKLDPDEKIGLQAERRKIERAAFAGMDVDFVVEDYTADDGEPLFLVVR